jgi:signal peptidase I
LTKDEESACFPGVAYHLPTGEVRNELLWGHNKFLSVQIAGHADDHSIFTLSHIFVERYINRCIKRPFDNVEIFRYYFSRGFLPEKPSDLADGITNHLSDSQGADIWTCYEHLSGPYLADSEYITSQFSAGRLDDISPQINTNLIPDKAAYRRNPQDLPILGVIMTKDESDEVSQNQKFLEDLVLRTKLKKTNYVN